MPCAGRPLGSPLGGHASAPKAHVALPPHPDSPLSTHCGHDRFRPVADIRRKSEIQRGWPSPDDGTRLTDDEDKAAIHAFSFKYDVAVFGIVDELVASED
jgi:hypothetical protein